MDSTRSFIQIRSAPIRLRRELQDLGFLAPIEIEHAIASNGGDRQSVGVALTTQGYEKTEIERAMNNAVARGVVLSDGNKLSIREDRREIVRRLLLLDILALKGRAVVPGTPSATASVLVPGYGAFHGLEMDELVNQAIDNGGALAEDISHSQTFASDIKALSVQGLCMVGR